MAVWASPPGLARDLAAGDANYLSLLDAADAYAAREGLDLPEEPAAGGWTCAVPGSPRSSGRPGLRSISAGCRSVRWTRVGRRCIGAASPRYLGCMSWGCLSVPPGVELHLWGGTAGGASGEAYCRAGVGTRPICAGRCCSVTGRDLPVCCRARQRGAADAEGRQALRQLPTQSRRSRVSRDALRVRSRPIAFRRTSPKHGYNSGVGRCWWPWRSSSSSCFAAVRSAVPKPCVNRS